MSTSVSNANSTPAVKQVRTARRWVVLAASLLMGIVGLLVIRTQGFVSGAEFAPSHFQHREFSFYEIPLLHVQITPIQRSGTTPKTATYLRQNGLIRPATGTPAVWHLVSLTRGLTGATPADASLLVDQLTLESPAGGEYWRKWSIDHPQQAKVLWPVVQTLAERELYLLMPPLFELAQVEQTATELANNLDRYLRDQYRELVVDIAAANQGELAEQLLDEAIADYPDDARLKDLRRKLAP